MSTASTLTKTRTVDLDHQQLLLLEGRRGTRIKVICGGVWLTHEGEPDDLFAGSAEEVAIRSHRRALIEGLGPTRVEVTESARGSILRTAVRELVSAGRSAWTAGVARVRSVQLARGLLASVGLLVGVAVPTLVIIGMEWAAPAIAAFA